MIMPTQSRMNFLALTTEVQAVERALLGLGLETLQDVAIVATHGPPLRAEHRASFLTIMPTLYKKGMLRFV